MGDVDQAGLTISNTATNDAFSEKLNAAFGTPTGNATATGSFTLLGSANSSSLIVGLNTSAAGARSGTVLTVSGNVYRLASASTHTPESVILGNVHVGAVDQMVLMLSNTAANDGFSEKLDAAFGAPTGNATAAGSIHAATNDGFSEALNATGLSATGDASASGSFNQLAPGGLSSALTVGVSTSIAGSKSGVARFNMASSGTGSSGLGTTAIGFQDITVTAQVNNFAAPLFIMQPGAGTLTGSGTAFTLDFGTRGQESASPQAQLGVRNNALAPADSLAGSFLANAPDFTLSGFTSFSGITAGQSFNNLLVSLQTDDLGQFNETITLSPRSQNGGGFDGGLDPVLLTLRGTVIPEPASGILLGAAGIAFFGKRRRSGTLGLAYGRQG